MNAKKFEIQEMQALLIGHWLSDMANFSSYIFNHLPDVNWAGFYLLDGGTLKLGPFCGKPACTEIAIGKGVCGQAYESRKTLLVDDVDQFPGHIRCDSDSKSEIVIPFLINDKIVGVFDVDSPLLSRFKSEDQELLEKSLQILSSQISNYAGPGHGNN